MYTLPSLPCALPTAHIPDDVDLQQLASLFVGKLKTLNEDDFTDDAIWRDTYAMTGTLRTFYTKKSIAAAWHATCKLTNPGCFAPQGQPSIFRAQNVAWVNIAFAFHADGAPATSCSGSFAIVPQNQRSWKIWMFRTILEQLDGQPNVDYLAPIGSSSHTTCPGPVTNGVDHTATNRAQGNLTSGTNPFYDCIIVGGGQSGLSVAGRLKALGVSYLVIDKMKQVGDNWALRYESAKLHTIRDVNHLPFERTFLADEPEFLPKDDVAKGYRKWVAKYGINVWLSTTLLSGFWDVKKEIWELKISRDGEESFLNCSYVVFAVGGGSQVPVTPVYPGREKFRGLAFHSADYTDASGWEHKHGVVVGSGNTAHDVVEDMLASGMESVTMVQRSKTFVIPVKHYSKHQARTYNPNIPTEVSDRITMTTPNAVGRLLFAQLLHGLARSEPEWLDALEAAGFLTERFGDLTYALSHRFGGYYMDVGASGKIGNGSIKIKSNSLPARWAEDGLEFEDGSHLKADVVVFATGFVGNMRIQAEELFGKDVADQLEDFWGLNQEGEINGAFQPLSHPAFWFHGGAMAPARFFSRFIALQIKAKTLHVPFSIYRDTPARNTVEMQT